jgi:hypothetical protein
MVGDAGRSARHWHLVRDLLLLRLSVSMPCVVEIRAFVLFSSRRPRTARLSLSQSHQRLCIPFADRAEHEIMPGQDDGQAIPTATFKKSEVTVKRVCCAAVYVSIARTYPTYSSCDLLQK